MEIEILLIWEDSIKIIKKIKMNKKIVIVIISLSGIISMIL